MHRRLVELAAGAVRVVSRYAPLRSRSSQAHKTWAAGLEDEIAFWDRWLRTGGGEWSEDYRRRLDPELPLSEYHRSLIDHLNAKSIRILDVGAGPLTLLGKKHPDKQLEIVATDALADQYADLLSRYAIDPPVRTVFAEAERLSRAFHANSFDLVYAQNCIDHVHNPLQAIKQMLRVAKPGCFVALGHTENEALVENFQGLHQWNFGVKDGEFMIEGADRRWNVSRELAHLGEFQCCCRNHWVQVHIRKHGWRRRAALQLRLVGRRRAPTGPSA